MEIAWTSRKHCIRQRSIVCSRNNKEAKPTIGNPNKTLNSLSSTDRWANRKDQPRIGTIFEGLHRS